MGIQVCTVMKYSVAIEDQLDASPITDMTERGMGEMRDGLGTRER